MEPIFDHERLEVYQTARAFTCEIQPLLQGLPRGNADSKDNLKRAATSVTRNIAEGGGRWRIPEKISFYQIARASATECAATLDELADLGLVREERIIQPTVMLGRVVSMLVAMIRSLDARGTRDMSG